jgi:Activator of Hsp90 ATPase homolog 1-like protein
MMTEPRTIPLPVRKSITVRAGRDRAFEVFTRGFGDWWPRSHHIGNAPMKRAVIEGFASGRCYSEQTDGTECDWGTILVWDPPGRLVLAWQVSPGWKYEAHLAKSSEVEVRFTEETEGVTRVDLEHRNFERHGAGHLEMREAVDSRNGWGDLLGMYAARVEAVVRGYVRIR